MHRTASIRCLFLPLLFLAFAVSAQTPEGFKSIHQTDAEFYRAHPELVDTSTSPPLLKREQAPVTEGLSHVVYGFHPYWISDATAQAYDYSLLSHVVYFSADVDTSETTTGGFSTTNKWATTQVVTYARNAGKKLHLCIVLFDKHDRILYDSGRRQNLINNIITEVNRREADGANIDFESMANVQALADSFRTFIVQLGTALKAAGKELTVELPAVDWSGKYFNTSFFEAAGPVVEYYFLMAYAYWWRGSSTAGPVSPLTSGISVRHVMRSIDDYLAKGCPPSKLIAGLPYYGIDWPVESSVRMAATTGNGSSRFYNSAKAKRAALPPSDVFFDGTYNVPWYRYQESGLWRQTWFDDSLSLSMKYDSVKTRMIAGAGMWALGYDAPHPELWGALRRAFAVSTVVERPLAELPSELALAQNYPNPFNGSTVIEFAVPSSGHAVVQVYDLLGRLQAVLFDRQAEGGEDLSGAVRCDRDGVGRLSVRAAIGDTDGGEADGAGALSDCGRHGAGPAFLSPPWSA